MVRVAVAEDEALLTVGRVPVHDTHVPVARDLADDALRHVDAVIEHSDIEVNGIKQSTHHVRCEERCLEEAPQNRLGLRLIFEIASCEEAECARECVFADLQAV